jgi:type II secretory pathway component PulF
MSEVVSNESVEEVTPELESEGQVTEAIEEIESLSEQEIEMLPVDEFGDKYVSVQVNGEEVQVPLKEALSGYQRQADYTRKTQELSEQRRQVQFGAALQEALQNDPKGTLELLKQHYGLDRQNPERKKNCMLTLLKSNTDSCWTTSTGF